jgi:hypothetical protein
MAKNLLQSHAIGLRVVYHLLEEVESWVSQ